MALSRKTIEKRLDNVDLRKNPFGAAFLWLRSERGFTQQDLAAHLNTSQSWLSKVEEGLLKPDAQHFITARNLSHPFGKARNIFDQLFTGRTL